MSIQTRLQLIPGITFPVIMAPMFLVSNVAMMQAAMRNGALGVFPTLNYREEGALEEVISSLHEYHVLLSKKGNFGVNLIVQKSNPYYKKHLEACVKGKVPFYITSLGNPDEVIKAAHGYGATVFCDVTNMVHAAKCASLNCDGFIAVGQGAGGHAGPNPLSVLVPALKKEYPGKTIIAAGGIATGGGILSALALGANGVSVGTRFIASAEAGVSKEYKDAVVASGMDEIVMTERLSGSPCTIIDTPYAQKIGYRANWFEKKLSNNPQTKKYFKMLIQSQGMKKLEAAIKPGNYNNLWCAGKSVELIDSITSCDEIFKNLESEFMIAFRELQATIQQ